MTPQAPEFSAIPLFDSNNMKLLVQYSYSLLAGETEVNIRTLARWR